MQRLYSKFLSQARNSAIRRSYAVVAQTQQPYDTSSQTFVANSPIQQLYKASEFEDKLITLLTTIRPYKMESNLIDFGDKLLNKEYRLRDMIPKGEEYDFKPYLKEVQEIVMDDLTLAGLFGKDYKQVLEDFIKHTPYLTPRTMDVVLQLNSQGYKKIVEKRAEKILAWCNEHAAEIQEADK
jgi:hypothetical protein